MAKRRLAGNYQAMANERFVKPPRLRAGSRIALVAPAGPVSEQRIERSVERCRELGLEPVLGKHARQRTGFLAGADEERAEDLQAALDDDSIDAVWALRGGYGSLRLLRHLDFMRMREKPKSFIGFSDNTTLHIWMYNTGLVSFHGPHPGGDFPDESRAAFEQVLFRATPAGELPLRTSDPAPRCLRGGTATGTLVGGNLSILAAACGTQSCLQARDCIVFVEDVNEPAYRIDRAITQLFQSGALVGVRGFAFGRFTEVPQSENDTPIDDVLFEIADQLKVPAIADLPIGHIEHNWTVPLGVRAELDADHAKLIITEAAVR